MSSPDITIRGAGIFGLSCAWELCRRGAKVQVVDPGGIGAGASGGVVGALAPHAPEAWTPLKQFQLESLLLAQSFWDQVRAAGGEDPGYGRLGRLQPVPDEAALLRARERASAAASLWQGQAIWEIVPAGTSLWEPPSPTGWLIRDTLSARLHPRQALAALARALASRGVKVQPEAPDLGLVLHATGAAGLAQLSQHAGREVGRALKGQAAVLSYDAGEVPQLYLDGLHVVPHVDGTVAIGSVDDRSSVTLDTDAGLEALIDRLRAALPWLADAPVRERWAGLRPRSRSRRPILGAWPGRPGHFIANGGFKIGFGLAPGVARSIAALILDGIDTLPPGCGLEDNL